MGTKVFSVCFVLGLVGITGCGPTVQEIQSATCSNSSFSAEWRCVKNAVNIDPRYQSPSFFKAKIQYIVYGDKLEIAVSKALMPDYQASMMLMEYADEIDRRIMLSEAVVERQEYWNQLNANLQHSIDANKVITCTHSGSITTCQ